jgi:hypothetical protein
MRKMTTLQLDNILPIPSLSDDHPHLHLVMTERPDRGLGQVGDPGLQAELLEGILPVLPLISRLVDLSGARLRMLITSHDK